MTMRPLTTGRRTEWFGHVGVGAALAVSLVALCVLAARFPTFPGDRWILEQALAAQTPVLAAVAAALAWTGSVPVAAVLVLLSLAVLWFRAPRMQFLTALAGAFLMLLGIGLKLLIARPRPDSWLSEVGSISYGFPSGHTIFATVFFGLALMFVGAWVQRPGLRLALRAVFLVLILSFGVSRVYLGAHWPSDVIGGWLYGATAVLALSWLAGHSDGLPTSRPTVPASACQENGDGRAP